jgi:hypothetical protein
MRRSFTRTKSARVAAPADRPVCAPINVSFGEPCISRAAAEIATSSRAAPATYTGSAASFDCRPSTLHRDKHGKLPPTCRLYCGRGTATPISSNSRVMRISHWYFGIPLEDFDSDSDSACALELRTFSRSSASWRCEVPVRAELHGATRNVPAARGCDTGCRFGLWQGLE